MAKVEKYGFVEEVAEDFRSEEYGAYVKTGFPKPQRRLKLVQETNNVSIENAHFWVLNHLKNDWGYGEIIKTLDTISTSEHSSFWGVIQQRKGIQQDRASQYLQTIGKMIQDLFKITREIRIIKERISLYDGVKKNKAADDIALKGYWVDMVEGGTKGQSNIYTMSQQLGFATLPDLFFAIFVKDNDDIDKKVETQAGEFNNKVKEVLRRKLATYVSWRKHTEDELKNRHVFTLKYLRQHWSVIRMYVSWVKPYLRNVQRLEAPDKYDRDAELISSFETALIEVEFIARRAPKKKGDPASTILTSLNYRVKPNMDFHADGYQQKGPIHVGRVEINLRNYGWTDEDVEAYMQYRDEEMMELIGMVDQSVKDALDSLGDELMMYLKEAGEKVDWEPKEEEEPETPDLNLFEPITALFGGFKDLLSFPLGAVGQLIPKKGKVGSTEKRGTSKAAKDAAKKAHGSMYLTYKNYKKQQQMVSW